jgi:hypothetical protein
LSHQVALKHHTTAKRRSIVAETNHYRQSQRREKQLKKEKGNEGANAARCDEAAINQLYEIESFRCPIILTD